MTQSKFSIFISQPADQFSKSEAGFYFEFGADKTEDKGASANENNGSQVESRALGRDGKGENNGAKNEVYLIPR